jgi:hypothetical protein
MPLDPANLINIFLAVTALSLYTVGSRRFYFDRHPFLIFLVLAIVVDCLTAVLASFRVTPTTTLPSSDFIPWTSPLFVAHALLAFVGMVGFISITIILLTRGTNHPYQKMRVWQYRILLPVWLVGEGIAVTNALGKALFHIRIYDYI